jgi:hypothetical protein
MKMSLGVELNRSKMQKSKQELMNELGKNSTEFCNNLKFLVNMLWNCNKDNGDITALKERLKIAARTNPITIIEIGGPQFFKYRESLRAKKLDFFLDKDFSEDVEATKREHGISGDTSSATEVIQIIKTTFSTFKDNEKTIIVDKAYEMLQTYIRYLMAAKALKAL